MTWDWRGETSWDVENTSVGEKWRLRVNFWTADADGSERELFRGPGCSPMDSHVIDAEISLRQETPNT
jgi:hypothetical protein